MSITASVGGKIDLSNVTQIVDPAGGDTRNRGVFVTADGAGSEINLSSLVSFTDANGGEQSSLTARSGGSILVSALTNMDRVSLTLNGTGTLPISQIVNFTDGTATLSGNDYEFPSLTNAGGTAWNINGVDVDLSSVTTLAGGSVALSNGGTANLSNASNIDGASLSVKGGVTLALPAAVGYDNSIDDTWLAEGSGSLLSLPNLTSITNGTGQNHDMWITASVGGKIDLSNVTQIVDPIAGDTRHRGVFVTADGAGSEINLSSLVNFTDANADEQSSLTARNLGMIQLAATHTNLVNVTTSETAGGMILGEFGMRITESTTQTAIDDADAVIEADVSPLVDVATAIWAAAGISETAVKRLGEVILQVLDLPADYLGYASATMVSIDHNAAGFGWFIDSTPWDDEEFDEDGQAIVGSEADGRIDLLTVVLHELGHVLELGHDDDPDSLMYDLLAPGVRRRISVDDVDALFAAQAWM